MIVEVYLWPSETWVRIPLAPPNAIKNSTKWFYFI